MASFVYHPDYCCDLGTHVFRTEKYRLLHRMILDRGLVAPDDVVTPEPAAPDDLRLVHTPAYVEDLLTYRHSMRTMYSELPISREIIDSFILGAGGTMAACRLTVTKHILTMNLAGGFHHAFPDWAEGFCYVNDVAIGVRTLQRDGLIRKAMVVDCDLHQGNGTAFVFRDEPDVFTFSIHQQTIYPIKRKSDLDIGLSDFCPAHVYLRELESNLHPALDEHRPEIVLYIAGADPYKEDQLGSLMLDMDDMARRDQIVLGACVERGIPVACVLAGGYAPRVEDTVRIHYNTAAAIVELDGGLNAG